MDWFFLDRKSRDMARSAVQCGSCPASGFLMHSKITWKNLKKFLIYILTLSQRDGL